MAISRRMRTMLVVAAALLLVSSLAVMGGNWWASYHFNEANRLVERQQFAEAYAHYVECLKVWRWSDSTQLLAGQTARRAMLYPEAEMHLDKCLGLRGRERAKSGDVALERVLIQAQQGEFGDIEEILWKKMKQNAPEKPLIVEALARGYMRMYRLGAALSCLKMILERDPDNVEALANRGWVYERTSGAVDAMKDYRRVLELRPDRDDVRLSLALLQINDNPKEARGEFEYLVERQPDNPDILLGLAHSYQMLAIPEKAGPLIDAVLARDPDNSKALTEKGLLANGTGNTVEGEALLRKAIEKDPGNLDAHFKLYLFLLGRPGRETDAQAQGEIHKLVEADRKRLAQIWGQEMSKTPYDPNLHYEVGMIYLRLGKPDLGRRWLNSAHKLDPSHQPTIRALSEFFKRPADGETAPENGQERSDKATSANAVEK